MYVQHNTEARSCNYCGCGQTLIITYSECVFVALGYPEFNVHASYCHLWPARLYNIFPHYLMNEEIFEKQLLDIKYVF